MRLDDELGSLAAAFGRMAAELKDSQDKLLSYGRGLEAIVGERTAELAQQKATLEVSVAERTAQLNAANDELRRQSAELAQRNREITLFSNMNDFLQTSVTEAEAYSVISQSVLKLFPDDSGAVYVLNDSRDMLEAAAVWGNLPPSNLIFPPNECFAHRRGRAHVALGSQGRCPHVTDDGHVHLCLTLLAQGETLGILYLLDGGPEAGDEPNPARVSEKTKLAKILADNIGLGIANLKLRETAKNLAIRDSLTGLFNRRYLQEALAQEQHRARRSQTQLAIIMIDIDHFKEFNDKFGHEGGDAVLRGLAATLSHQVRQSDLVCRYGGEEFLLLLSPATVEGALKRAEMLRESATLLKVSDAAHRYLGPITLSLGVAIFPDQASDPASMIRAADLALYQAKRQGRNRVVMSDARPELDSLPVERPPASSRAPGQP
jgi:diguanylate cyclase (GGDEF)-like protein